MDKNGELENLPVDIVYLWCDASDNVWREKKNAELAKYGKKLDKDSTNECRFIDNNELKYSLRSLEKYAPWIRKIFIVTDNQIPEWLDTTNPKIQMIFHSQILPEENLPVFNSRAIETAIFRIPDLSEHFLFANDDMFFGAPVDKSFFFNNDGKPVFRFSGRKIINKPYRHLYGYSVTKMYNLIKSEFGNFKGYFPHHNIDAYRKSDMEKCYEKYKESFDITSGEKFREKESIQRSIYGYYAVANNLAQSKVVSSLSAKAANILKGEPLDSVIFSLTRAKLKKLDKNMPYLFCTNDSINTTDDDRAALREFLEQKFPYPSEFEKQDRKKSEIYVCYHKENSNYLKNDAVIPIEVGAALKDEHLGILKDDDGDNISGKNKNYCELTALYRLWKNSDADYTGLMHYRRLFDLSFGTKRWYNGFPDNILEQLSLNSSAINYLMKDCDIIMPMKRVVQQSKTIYSYYIKTHYISDMDKTLEILKTKYPEFYDTAIDVLKNGNKMYLYNMFIAPKKFLDEYCEWLFDILGTLEQDIQPEVETRDEFQQRVYGFLSERLLTIYVEYMKKQGLRVKEAPVVYCEAKKKRYDVFQTRTKIYKILVKFGIRRPHWREQYGV